MTVLNNRGQRIERDGGNLWLAGVDDLTEGKPSLADALEGSRPDEPIVLLSHHGGQVKILGHAPIVHSKFGYVSGTFHEIESMLYVSRGAGLTLLPIRIGAPAEIPIVTLHTNEAR